MTLFYGPRGKGKRGGEKKPEQYLVCVLVIAVKSTKIDN